jgi:hypothetical protein
MHVERFDAAPARGVGAGATETLCDECAGVRDIGKTRVYGECARIVDEIVDGLGVFCDATGRRGSGVWIRSSCQARSYLFWRCALVERAMERSKEVV